MGNCYYSVNDYCYSTVQSCDNCIRNPNRTPIKAWLGNEYQFKTWFKSLSREELKKLLEEAGFIVEDGEGRVIFLDEDAPQEQELDDLRKELNIELRRNKNGR